MARVVITDEIIEQINERYCILGVKSQVARELGISPATVSRYLIDGYVPISERNITIFTGTPSPFKINEIKECNANALRFLMTHLTKEEKEDMVNLQKEIF